LAVLIQISLGTKFVPLSTSISMVKKYTPQKLIFFNTMIYGNFILRKDLVIKGIISAPWCLEGKIS
jgi:hypothetical protein